MTYTVTVHEPRHDTDATEVVVTDALPAGLTTVTPPTAPTAGTAAVAANTWTWTIPTRREGHGSGDADRRQRDVRRDRGRSTHADHDHEHGHHGRDADRPGLDQQHGVGRPDDHRDVADLNVTTAVDDYKPKQGDTIQIGIQVSNTGPADATNVVIRDVLPTGLKYVSCEPTPCEQSGLRRQSSQLFSMPSDPCRTARAPSS